MSLPIYQTCPGLSSVLQTLSLLQTGWSTAINPLIDNPSNKSRILKNVPLVSGSNVIDHLLGRPLQGWRVVRQRGAAAGFYDNQDINQTPNLTLILFSNATVVVDIEVF